MEGLLKCCGKYRCFLRQVVANDLIMTRNGCSKHSVLGFLVLDLISEYERFFEDEVVKFAALSLVESWNNMELRTGINRKDEDWIEKIKGFNGSSKNRVSWCIWRVILVWTFVRVSDHSDRYSSRFESVLGTAVKLYI